MESARSSRDARASSRLTHLAGRLLALAAVVVLLVWLVERARVVEDVELPADESEIDRASLLVPVRGVSASELYDSFSDPRSGNRVHRAVDIHAARGTLVVAASAGRVRRIFSSRLGGLSVYQLDRGGTRCFYYAHLDRYAEGLREGLLLNRGDPIGYVGTTGNAPDHVPHLHFGVFALEPSQRCREGEPVDPLPLLKGLE